MLFASRHWLRFLIGTVTVLVILAIGWWTLWSWAAARYQHVIDGWIEAGRSNGYAINYGERRLFGFPRHIVLRFTNVQWKNTDNILFNADDIDIAARPWEWQEFDARFKQHAQITAPVGSSDEAFVLGGQDGRAHVELDQDGLWHLTRISLADAKFGKAPRYIVQADRLNFSATRPLQAPKDHSEPGLTLTGRAEHVTLPDVVPSPFGLQMDKLDLDIRVMDKVPDFRSKDAVTIWNNNSGIVEFDNIHLDWGPLKLTSKGTMGFDDDLQPEGAFSAIIGNHQQVLQALMEHDFIAKREGAMLNSALDLFAKPSTLDNNTGIQLPITVQLGGLFLGPVRLFQYPPIDWSSATGAAPTDPVGTTPAAAEGPTTPTPTPSAPTLSAPTQSAPPQSQ